MEKKQEYWGNIPAWSFFLAATGAMMVVIVAVTDLLGNQIAGQINGWVSLVSMVAAGIGSLLLLIELPRKEKGHLVNSRPGSSIMSFGSILQSLFIVLAFLYATFFFGFIPWYGLIWLKKTIAVIGIIIALALVAYPGIELGEARGRAFWNGGALVSVFLISGAATGAAGLLLLLTFLAYGDLSYIAIIRGLLFGLLTVQLITVTGYVVGMKFSAAEEARRSAEIILRGDLKGTFWVGVIILGTLVPLLSMLLDMLFFTAIGAILVLAGGICFRMVFLKAAVRMAMPGEGREGISDKQVAQLAVALERRWQEKASWLNPNR
jgi:formate-dependent nitrite reductase membrane component NrfD